MLYFETVEPRTLSLLKELMNLPAFQPFSLVGDTALSLRCGHCSSIDLDLFFHEKFDQHQIVRNLAMKIQALLGRGKKKDFWDLYYLLHHYSLQQIMDWHKQKYPSQTLAISIPHAITYFVDTNESETPVSFKKQTRESVKKGIQGTVSDYLK